MHTNATNPTDPVSPVPTSTSPLSAATTPAPAIPGEAEPNINLLDDVEYVIYQAGAGKRFLNYLIDSLVSYCAWRLFLAYWLLDMLYLLKVPIRNIILLDLIALLSHYPYPRRHRPGRPDRPKKGSSPFPRPRNPYRSVHRIRRPQLSLA
jgi:hypothetical protein